jgi:hypothetical protein
MTGKFSKRLAAWLLLAACGPSAGTGATATPQDVAREGPRPEGTQEGDDSGDQAARLRRLEQRLSAAASTSAQDPRACEEVCSLATSICGIQRKLCDLADRFPQEDDYQALCREAKNECREAQDACVGCVQRHSSG